MKVDSCDSGLEAGEDASSAGTKVPDRFEQRLRARLHTLSPRMCLVARHIERHRADLLSKSAIDLAKDIGVSDATVIRTVQALGFEGLVDLREMLAGTLGHMEATVSKASLTIGELRRDADHAISYVLSEHRQALESLAEPSNRNAMNATIGLLADARRIGIFGMSASGMLADYAARLFARNGYPAYVLNRTGIGLAEQLLELAPGDALLVMIRMRSHREVLAAVQEAVRLDIPVILITGQRRHALARLSQQIIVLPRADGGTIPLHGPTLACLEMLMLGLMAAQPQRSLDSLGRLVTLRAAIRSGK